MGSFARTAGGVAAATLIGAGALVASPSAAGAQTFVPCDTTALINAITAANTAGSGTLQLASFCTYGLTTPVAGDTRGPNAFPIITGNIVIVGGRSTRIRRVAAAPFRIFQVGGTGRLSLSSLFVEGGNAGLNPGGGILINPGGRVRLTSVTVALNTADNGAGLANNHGTLTLQNTLVDFNHTRTNGGGGGGIYNDGTLTLNSSRLTANEAGSSGGGIYNEQGGTTTLVQSTLNQNAAGVSGGGLFNGTGGSATLSRTLVTENVAATGGGIFDATGPGPVTVGNSSVSGNFNGDCTGGEISGCAA